MNVLEYGEDNDEEGCMNTVTGEDKVPEGMDGEHRTASAWIWKGQVRMRSSISVKL